MKKLYALIAVLALLLPVLAGCQSANPLPPQNNGAATTGTTPPETTQPVVTPPETTAPIAPPADTTPQTTARITADEAIAIALKDAKLKKDQVRDLDVELDRDDGALHYDVDFEKDGKDYDYKIDATSGDVLHKEVPRAPAAADSASSSSSSSSSSKKQLTKTEARDVALKHAGLSVSQVRELDVELDRDDGKLHYDVDFEANGYDYDYEIDAATGKILKSEKERD